MNDMQKRETGDSSEKVSISQSQEEISAISIGASIAGATAALAVGSLLLILGLAAGIPLPGTRESISTLSILWIVATQLIASGLGGYIAGRIQTQSIAKHRSDRGYRAPGSDTAPMIMPTLDYHRRNSFRGSVARLLGHRY